MAGGAAYLVGVLVWATGHPEFDYIGMILSLGGCGIVGAAVVDTVADMDVRHDGQRSHGQRVSGV